MATDTSSTEDQIRELCGARKFEAATCAALELYGPEIFGYLIALTGRDDVAWDVFQQFSADLWKGLSGFEWNASLRTWGYKLAFHAASRFMRRAHHRRERPLESEMVRLLAESISSTTPPYMRQSAVAWLDEARRELSLDEQTLLTLRVDRKMPFKEIAAVLADEGQAVSASALRKRFERLKQRLRELAARDGRIPKED